MLCKLGVVAHHSTTLKQLLKKEMFDLTGWGGGLAQFSPRGNGQLGRKEVYALFVSWPAPGVKLWIGGEGGELPRSHDQPTRISAYYVHDKVHEQK